MPPEISYDEVEDRKPGQYQRNQASRGTTAVGRLVHKHGQADDPKYEANSEWNDQHRRGCPGAPSLEPGDVNIGSHP